MHIHLIYASLSGNTGRMADFIEEALLEGGCTVDRINISYEKDYLDALHGDSNIIFGTYTWGDGALPTETRSFLKDLFAIDVKGHVAVFGTGEKQFKHYCRAIRESAYHFEKNGWEVHEWKLQIEQRPKDSEVKDIKQWTNNMIGDLSNDKSN